MSAPALLGSAGAALALAIPVIVASGVLEAEHRAAGVADAAALAAADMLSGWVDGDPCGSASRLAAESGATVVSCILEPRIGEVRMRIEVPHTFGAAQARARAGPPNPE